MRSVKAFRAVRRMALSITRLRAGFGSWFRPLQVAAPRRGDLGRS